jgi:hypothetical protein
LRAKATAMNINAYFHPMLAVLISHAV